LITNIPRWQGEPIAASWLRRAKVAELFHTQQLSVGPKLSRDTSRRPVAEEELPSLTTHSSSQRPGRASSQVLARSFTVLTDLSQVRK
jgi:hypothetical protein